MKRNILVFASVTLLLSMPGVSSGHDSSDEACVPAFMVSDTSDDEAPTSAAAKCPACSQSAVHYGLELSVPTGPVAVPEPNGTWLRYELRITNYANQATTLRGIEIVDEKDGRVLHRIADKALAYMLGPHSAIESGSGALTMRPGQQVIVYLDPSFEGTAPESLRHRVHYALDKEPDTPQWVDAGIAHVDDGPLPRIGPPLRGGPWIAVYDPQLARGHRRMVYALNGQARIPGRYAIDWMLASPTADRPSSLGGGVEVLAVADARVVAALDGVPEPAPGSDPSRIPLSGAPGNYIALDLGEGRYAFYEHLRPGLLVKPGDTVRRGQVIARIGTTGHTTTPHLHFHVGNTPSPMATEGMPFLIDGMDAVGRYGSIGEAVAGGEWKPAATRGKRLPRLSRRQTQLSGFRTNRRLLLVVSGQPIHSSRTPPPGRNCQVRVTCRMSMFPRRGQTGL